MEYEMFLGTIAHIYQSKTLNISNEIKICSKCGHNRHNTTEIKHHILAEYTL